MMMRAYTTLGNSQNIGNLDERKGVLAYIANIKKRHPERKTTPGLVEAEIGGCIECARYFPNNTLAEPLTRDDFYA